MGPKLVNVDRQCQKSLNSQNSFPKPDSNSVKYYKIVTSIYLPSRREFVELVTIFFLITSTLAVNVKKNKII